MSTKSRPAPLLVEDVKANLQCPSTTTPQTLNVLRAILGLELQHEPTPDPPVTTATQTPKAISPRAKVTGAPRRPPSKKPVHVAICEETPTLLPTLDIKTRRSVATEVFNTTLKTLSKAAKDQQEQGRGSPRPRSRPTAQQPAGPLKTCSPNRQSKSNRGKAEAKDDVSFEATVECTVTAIECLRQLEREAKGPDAVDLRLEQGALMVLDRTITLGSMQQAESQLRQLHEQYWKRRKNSISDSEVKPDESGFLLPLAVETDNDKSSFKFATTLQSTWLRLAMSRGPTYINKTTVKRLGLDNVGSPPRAIIEGHRLGHLDSEACGMQLRTLSLALTKLSTISMPKSKNPDADCLLELGCIALQIKTHSWKHLNQQPDLYKDLWTPIRRCMQQHLISTKAKTPGQILQVCVSKTSAILSELGFVSDVPVEVSRLLGEPAALSAAHPECLSDRMGKLKIGGTINDLLLALDDAATRVELYPKEAHSIEHPFERLRNDLDSQTRLTRADLTTVFLKIARVRKSLLTVCLTIEKETATGKVSPMGLQVQAACIRTLYSFVNFVLRCLQQSPSNAERSKPSGKPSAVGDLLLTYAKTVEAAMSVDEFSTARSAILSEEAKVALSRVLQISEIVQSSGLASTAPSSTRSFFEGIPVRVSQAFWSRYLWLTENRRPRKDCMEALQTSIDVVEERTLSERQAAVLSIKYEKLAGHLEETKSYSKAAQAVQRGIDLGIELGALNDAVEAYVLGPSDGIWNNAKSSYFTFGKNLVSYARLSLLSQRQDVRFAFDKQSLPLLHRFLIIERQILSILSNSLTVTKEQLKHAITHAWKLLGQPEYAKHRLQYTSQMLYLLERSQKWDPSDFFTHEAIRCLTEKVDEKLKASKDQSESLLTHTISIQWTLITGSLKESLVNGLVADLKGYFGSKVDKEIVGNSNLNVRILSSQLVALGDFSGVLGNDRTQLDILMMLRMLQQRSLTSDRVQQLARLVQIAMVQNRLDNTSEAGKAFAQAESMLEELEDSSEIITLWTLGYAEYLLNIADFQRSAEMLQQARTAFSVLETATGRSASRLEKDSILCRAAYLASRIAFHQGQLGEAVSYAKQAARLSTTIWMSIEKKLQHQPRNQDDDSSIRTLKEDMSNLTLSFEQPNGQHNRGARYWSAISLHRQVLQHVASLFAHLGVYQDSLYYSQQVSKISQATAGMSLNSSNVLCMALLYAGADQRETARQLLSTVRSTTPQVQSVTWNASDLLTAGETCLLLEDTDGADDFLQRLRDLHLPWLQSRFLGSVKPDSLRNVTPRKKANKTVISKRGKQAAKKPSTEVPEKPDSNTHRTMTIVQCNFVARAVALESAVLEHRQTVNADSKIETLHSNLPTGLGPLVTVSQAFAFLQHALRCFSADPSSNALAETALAMPVRYKSTRKSGQMSLLVDESMMLTPSVAKVSRTSKSSRMPPGEDDYPKDGPQLLSRAYEMLQAVSATRRSLLSSPVVALMYKVLSQITLMSSAVAAPIKYSPAMVVLQSLVPKEVNRARERQAIQAEAGTTSLAQLQQWPELHFGEHSQGGEPFHTELKQLFQDLPRSWSVVSLGLSHDCKELLLSKVETSGSPFLMRVPLGRPDLVEENEPHEFTFDVAKAELLEIIDQANASSHDERGQGDKQARSSWYGEREALDSRLKALLTNIENVWFGGFRGLLTSQQIDHDLLSRFGQSLSQSLNQHLPSRQKASKTSTRVDLHAHVLELFTTIPSDDSPEFEDSITDLLYFVIDVLQFNGEPNAYDEIDFDAILVDVLDALRSYHAVYSADTHPTRHTILIIDKELEAFPWESLPCMQGRPVSRMPSLGSIKERLDLIRAQSPTADALCVPSDTGAYILNPSSDLKSTQETFQSTLANQLSGFTFLINTPPTSAQFESFLTSQPLLLYFGHGSGAQYILKRRIRQMQQCAVTWLMGCSSAKMTECGSFESHGIPNVYMHGGSAAVVGTLWDVTDRDLDRFAMKALDRWGLVDAPSPDAKGKGRNKVKTEQDEWSGSTREQRRGKVALDEAVSVGREACYLRYLNGAAVVVYGIPVVLG